MGSMDELSNMLNKKNVENRGEIEELMHLLQVVDKMKGSTNKSEICSETLANGMTKTMPSKRPEKQGE